MRVGRSVGGSVGSCEGLGDGGFVVGCSDGTCVGVSVGVSVGLLLGCSVGVSVGALVGCSVGVFEGLGDGGFVVGVSVGAEVGTILGFAVGLGVGAMEGLSVGEREVGANDLGGLVRLFLPPPRRRLSPDGGGGLGVRPHTFPASRFVCFCRPFWFSFSQHVPFFDPELPYVQYRHFPFALHLEQQSDGLDAFTPPLTRSAPW